MAYIDKGERREEIMAALTNGDRMTQKEFHELYEEEDEGFRAELIAGMVFVRQPLSHWHGKSHGRLSMLIDTYAGYTPGVEMSVDATVILGRNDEVQPDVLCRIAPEFGGQSRDYLYRKDEKEQGPYIKGSPELVAEVAHSSRAIDLHLKRQRYERAGVIEYVVLCLAPKEIHWFDLANRTTIESDGGILRSIVLPGLWIDEAGLLENDFIRVIDTLKL